MAILHPHGIVGLNDLPEKLRALGEEGAGSEESQALGERGLQRQGLEVQTLENQRLESPASESQTAVKTLPISGLDLKEYLARLERDLIEKALDDSRGVVSRAADRLSIGRTTLVEKMRKYKLPRAGASSVFDDSELQENDAARDPSARLQ
jgi:sigma-54 specific flagellar transcriptional regulator A